MDEYDFMNSYRVLKQDQMALFNFTSEDILFSIKMTKMNWSIMVNRFNLFFEVICKFNQVVDVPASTILAGLRLFNMTKVGVQNAINENLLFPVDAYKIEDY